MKKENQLIISQLAEEDLKDATEFYNSKKEGFIHISHKPQS